ncbi:hypothetical protein ACLOJK_025001 [Asimina triloba]
MFHFLFYKTLFRFKNNMPVAIRIQSLPNPSRKCHYQTNPPSPLIQYLQNSLGFSPEWALKAFKQLKGYNPRHPDAAVAFLKSLGLSQTHIQSIVCRAPSLLSCVHPDSRLSPKVQFLKDRGVSESAVADLLVSNPYIFTRSLEGHIKPLLDLLVSALGTHEFAVQLLINTKYVFNPDWLSRNISILRNCGVQNRHISKLLVKHPRVLGADPRRFNEVVEMVKGMGFQLHSYYSFVQAVDAILGMSRNTWDAKFKAYTSLGWSPEQVLLLFRKQPNCMMISEEKIRKGFDYLTKELGWGPPYILTHPTLLLLSLEKRVIPRHRFLQFLASKGIIKKDKTPVSSFLITENKFLKNFVLRYEWVVPSVLKIYEDMMGSKQVNVRE